MGYFDRAVKKAREAHHLGLRYAFHVGRSNANLTRLPVKGVGTVTLRTNSSDRWVFNQVFVVRSFDIRRFAQFEWIAEQCRVIKSRGRRPIILDLGANVGASAIWFSQLFPDARVIAVEPEPQSAELCRMNTMGFDVTVVPAAIGSRNGRVGLAIESGQEWCARTVRDTDGEVPVVTIAELMEAEGADAELLMVKIDIEGFESDLFADHTEWVSDTSAIVIEPHDWLLPGEGSSRNFRRVLNEHPFDVMIMDENLFFVRRPTAGEVDHSDRQGGVALAGEHGFR